MDYRFFTFLPLQRKGRETEFERWMEEVTPGMPAVKYKVAGLWVHYIDPHAGPCLGISFGNHEGLYYELLFLSLRDGEIVRDESTTVSDTTGNVLYTRPFVNEILERLPLVISSLDTVIADKPRMAGIERFREPLTSFYMGRGSLPQHDLQSTLDLYMN